MADELRLGFPGADKKVRANPPDGTPPPWDLDTKLDVLGKDHPRLDARDKVTGRAKYAYDMQPDGLIYAKMLRSPHASAKVANVDLARAKALPGVLHAKAFPGRVRYAGQHVAGVAAETEEILDDALALIEVEYEVLPCVVTVEDARADGAPAVLANGGNVRPSGRAGAEAAIDQLHAEADVVLEREYTTQVQTHSCLETHGSVSLWKGDELTIWASTQATFAFRAMMARSLGVPPQKVTVITEHMGGGFGSKFGPSAWDVFCAEAARATKRPCKYLLDRRAEHLVAGNRPNSIQRCKFSVKKDGTLMGAFVRSFGTAGVGRGAGVYNPGIYKFAGASGEQFDVVTHAGGGRAFRAPRHPQGIFALEGMIDELADAIGMDPLALRKKNDPHPVRRAQYEIGAKEIGWHRRAELARQKGRVRRGLGMASARWPHTGRAGTVVRCRIGKDGSVLVANGAQDIGTGMRTVLAVHAAEELGLPVSAIDVRVGHTDDPVGPASGGSTTTPSISPAARKAAWMAKVELLSAVAQALGGGDPTKMDLKGGKVVGASKELTFAQACALLPTDAVDVQGRAGPADFGLPGYAPEVAGVQFAEVEVDLDTGSVRCLKVVAIQDCGRVVDPLLARSQINGGVIQGVSYALFEDRILDRTRGDMLNANFLDYKILGAVDMPEIVSIPFTVAEGKTSTGVSSLGEPPTTPTAGAVANAVAHAIGARVRSLPITPDKVLAALAEGQG